MSQNPPLISLSDITKSFGSLTVLHDINIDIPAGEFFSLLGPSGCGKTTLLRILAGIERPSGGVLKIDGQPMNNVAAHKRPTNMVFQSYAIFPHLNVAENIGYGLRNMRMSRAEAASRVDEAIGLVKLDGMATRNAHQLSGGQRQRVALARALVMRPKVLLLDEPLSALDKKLREEMQLELRALQRTVGITFVFVTHDQEEALTLSDRIAIMSGGRVLQIDTPRGLYDRPVNREVAEFIGTMNLIEGKVSRIDDQLATLDCAGIGSLTGEPGPQKPAVGERAFLAIRPEKLTLGDANAAQVGNRLNGQIRDMVYLGDRIHYQIAVPGLEAPIALFVNNASGAEEHKQGQQVALLWAEDAGRVLPS